MKRIQSLLILATAGILNMHLLAQTSNTAAPTEQISFETFEAKLKQAGANAQIIDVRTAEEFKLNHLKGAVHLDVTNEAKVQQFINTLDRNKPVFVYAINNSRSNALVKTLKQHQFPEAYALPGGIAKWVGAGRSVETITSKGLSSDEYNKLLVSDKLVLVDIHSKYCPGCQKLAPIVDAVSAENTTLVKAIKIELFENKQLGKELNIQSVPTLILYKNGKVVWQKSGVLSKEEIENALHQDYAHN
ncbi:MAG TPA: thioredoxin domain-containing protein [Bacteroidia bacterium]|nr:thioredoxin domain-containing protein [Bacteroidia bacterium]